VRVGPPDGPAHGADDARRLRPPAALRLPARAGELRAPGAGGGAGGAAGRRLRGPGGVLRGPEGRRVRRLRRLRDVLAAAWRGRRGEPRPRRRPEPGNDSPADRRRASSTRADKGGFVSTGVTPHPRAPPL